jgi:hypothetical protein
MIAMRIWHDESGVVFNVLQELIFILGHAKEVGRFFDPFEILPRVRALVV